MTTILTIVSITAVAFSLLTLLTAAIEAWRFGRHWKK